MLFDYLVVNVVAVSGMLVQSEESHVPYEPTDVTRNRLTRYPSSVDRNEMVSVATPEALYRMKKGTVRLQDQADAAALRERFNLKDEE